MALSSWLGQQPQPMATPGEAVELTVRAARRGGRGGRGQAVRGRMLGQATIQLGRTPKEGEQRSQGRQGRTLRSCIMGQPSTAAAGARRPAPSQLRRSTAAARARTRAAQAARRSGSAADRDPSAAP